MIDEFDLRRIARELQNLYRELDAAKHVPAKPPEVRVLRPAPGPSTPGNWLWISRATTMEQRLREVAFNAFADIQTKLRDGDARPQRLLELIAFNAQPISELTWAGDLLDELTDQARQLGKWLNPPEPKQVANADPYLTADSIQRSLTAKGLSCPPATIRSWAQRGHVATKQRRDGHTAYRLADIINRLTSTN